MVSSALSTPLVKDFLSQRRNLSHQVGSSEFSELLVKSPRNFPQRSKKRLENITCFPVQSAIYELLSAPSTAERCSALATIMA